MGKRLFALAFTAVTAATALIAAPAYADAAPLPQSQTEVVQSYLATPQELEAAGRPQSQIDAQRAAIAALPPAEKARQDALRASQQTLTAKFTKEAASPSTRQFGATPMTVKASCSNVGTFEVGGNSASIPNVCFSGEGEYDGVNTFSWGFWTGDWEGRELYYSPATTGTALSYWTVWEPPSYSWHAWNVYVESVQLQHCPTC